MSVFELHDSYFDPESGRISSYFSRLSIMIGEESVQFCILDKEKNTVIGLADYRLVAQATDKPGDLPAQLDKLFSEDKYLLKKYPAIVVGVASSVHTLVPAPLFDDNQRSEYLGLNFRLEENCRTGSDRIQEMDAFNVYAYSQELHDLIVRYYSEAAIMHRSTAFIKAVCQSPQAYSNQQALFLQFNDHDIEFACFENGKPVFNNSFSYLTKEDVLYFVLYVLGQLKIRPDKVTLTLSGLIDEGSEIQRMLVPYFPELTYLDPIGSFNYSPLIAQAPLHHFPDLLALALCGS